MASLLDSVAHYRGRWESPERSPNIPMWEREWMDGTPMCEVRKEVMFEAIELKLQRKVTCVSIWSTCLRALPQPIALQICSSIGSPRHMVILCCRHWAYFPKYAERPKDDTVKCIFLNCLRTDGKREHLNWFLNYYPWLIVLILTVRIIIFSIAACMGLCFGSALETVLITQKSFGYSWAALYTASTPFLLLLLLLQKARDVQRAGKTHRQDSWAQLTRGISHTTWHHSSI